MVIHLCIMVKIMIVDDNTDMRYTIKECLSSNENYEFVEASSGDECLEMISSTNPDLILMDVMMPGTDGIATAMLIRSNKDYKNVKIIFLSAKTDSLTRGMAAVNGDDFIEKPFNADDLNNRILDKLKTGN